MLYGWGTPHRSNRGDDLRCEPLRRRGRGPRRRVSPRALWHPRQTLVQRRPPRGRGPLSILVGHCKAMVAALRSMALHPSQPTSSPGCRRAYTHETFLASRRRMPSQISHALIAFPRTREALWSAGKARCASRLTARARFRLRRLGDVTSERGARRSVTLHQANEAAPCGAVRRDEQQWWIKDGPDG